MPHNVDNQTVDTQPILIIALTQNKLYFLHAYHYDRCVDFSSPQALNMAASQRYRQLIVEQRNKLLIIKFNRPSRKNALSRESYRELTRALLSIAHNDFISIVALTGVGDWFTSGNDLSQTKAYADASQFFKSANFVLRCLINAVLHCPKPLVAVVNGPCLGIGFTLTALCDVVYCTDNAYFQAPFTKLGICPEACSSYLLPLILGRSKASEVLYFGATLNAQQALQFGFVADVLRFKELDNILWPKLLQYAELPLSSLSATKRLLHHEDEIKKMLKYLNAECYELGKLRQGTIYLNAIERFINRNKSKL